MQLGGLATFKLADLLHETGLIKFKQGQQITYTTMLIICYV
jgi:hypothetical protein